MPEKIAVTMGEPGGIGPEVALKASAEALSGGLCSPFLVGDPEVFRNSARSLGMDVAMHEVSEDLEPPADAIGIIDTGPAGNFSIGAPTPDGGGASVAAIRKALELAKAGHVRALVTAPISKEALKLAGQPWPGHTEMLAELTGTEEYAMMLMGGGLRVILVTIHTALREVPGLVDKGAVVSTLRMAKKASDMLGIETPRIAVCGLNPHAGEAGMFGREEEEIIGPAIEEAAREGIASSGPHAPDTVFFRASRGEFDIVVAMYHDQGLIPVKLLAFETGVNVTVGLPVIRTSPDHGTAYEIAGAGKADHGSMLEAIKVALELRLPQ